MRLREVKEEIAREEGFDSWNDLIEDYMYDTVELMEMFDAVSVRYATEKLKDAAGFARMLVVDADKDILRTLSEFPLENDTKIIIDRQRIADTKID